MVVARLWEGKISLITCLTEKGLQTIWIEIHLLAES